MEQVLKKSIFLFAYLLFASYSYANNALTVVKGQDVKGIVIDANGSAPVEFATVALYAEPAHTLYSGGITNESGEFVIKNVSSGSYSLEIAYVGYITTSKEVTVSDALVNLGKIRIKQDVKQLAVVNVVADRASVDYKIDKKVVNVGQQLNALSGSAIDVLENVPSMKVDIDGNVSMRGSTSFTVLIDGRPTPLEASDALRQIPASSIENIEIITNPSAKYEPDGASGVLNIITKKNSLNGFSGIYNLFIGVPKRMGGDFILDYRTGKWHFFGGVNGRINESESESDRMRYVETDNVRNYTISTGKSHRVNNGWGLNGGADYQLTETSVLGFNFRYGNHTNDNDNKMDYQVFSLPGTDTVFYTSNGNSSHGGNFNSLGLYYSKKFDGEEHTLDVQVNLNGRDNDEESENNMIDTKGNIYYGQKNNQTGPGNGYRFKIDYVRPVSDVSKLSIGAQGRINPSDDKYAVSMYDTIKNEYVYQDEYSYETKYLRQTYSVYAMFASQLGKFGYQGGVRGEYTYQDLELSGDNGKYHYAEPTFFPTIHLSYEMPADQQVMLSYTRRINRARPWQLQPYLTWQDAYNVRRGNPDLEPEYVNSVDFGYQKKFGDNFIALDAYYRLTENKIERIQTIFEGYNDVILNTTRNVGSDYATGAEITFNYSPIIWYQLNIMGDVYDYKKEGVYDGVDFSQHSFNWNVRVNNVLKFTNNSRMQVDFNYRSKSVTSQGYNKPFFSTNVAYKHELFDRKLTATVQARNVLNTIKRESVTDGPGFHSTNVFKPQWPSISIMLSYKMNNYKVRDDEEQDNAEGDFGM